MRYLIVIFILALGVLGLAQSSAEILNETVTYTISKDGSVQKKVSQRIQLNDAVAFGTFGEWFYTYNPSLESVEILKSETVQPDGTVVPTPENGMMDQGPSAVANAPDFSYLRERMVSHTGLEPGCVVEFVWVVSDLKPFRTVIFESMSANFPIQTKRVSFVGSLPGKVLAHGNIEKSGKNSKIFS